MAFRVTCTPGRSPAAEFMHITEDAPALVLYLDPDNLVIQLPPFPTGDQVLARFCRELAREATKLADELDVPGPRHLLREEGGGDDGH